MICNKLWSLNSLIWLKHFSGSDRHKDHRQRLTLQPHVRPAGSQPNRPQSGLLPAFPAPQRQSADWQEVTDDGGRKLGQPTGTRFWTGEDGNMFVNLSVVMSLYRVSPVSPLLSVTRPFKYLIVISCVVFQYVEEDEFVDAIKALSSVKKEHTMFTDTHL